MNDHASEQQWLIESLQNPNLYDHPVTRFEVIETHISWVLLTGYYAYKIKKPINFGFLDFSTLEKRYFCCREELRLNRRLAPNLYLGVVTINGSREHLEINGQGPAIEYAVKMVEFPQSAQFDGLSTADGGLDSHLMDRLAKRLAHFHLNVDSAATTSDWGEVKLVQQAVLDNFAQIRHYIKHHPAILPVLDRLELWSREQIMELAVVIGQRKAGGFVKECHGDMHLRNIALWNDEIIVFDCIEFNKSLSFIDVISEIAFLIMDLEGRGDVALGQHFLNSYLEITGDYEGLRLLRFYKVYRAVVRAKVDILRTGQEQPDSKEYSETFAEFLHYITLAERYTHPVTPYLLVSHGVSGAGKSAGAQALAAIFPAIRIRSDVERKRLFPEENTGGEVGVERGRYSPEASQKIYARLVEIARDLLAARYSVIIDAANLKYMQRQQFIDLSRELDVRCCILSYRASEKTLQSRIKKRAREGKDASDATVTILEHQCTSCEQLTDNELLWTLKIDTEVPLDVEEIKRHIQSGRR